MTTINREEQVQPVGTNNNPWPTFSETDDLLDQLVKLSRYYGSDPRYVLAGGGNTSVKDGQTLYVKASGAALAVAGREGYVALDRARLQEILDGPVDDDPRIRESQFRKATLASRIDPEGGRPSVESVFHHLMPGRFVVHTHAIAANSVGCCVHGQELIDKWFGAHVVWIPYVEPGVRLAKAIRDALAAYTRRTSRDCPDAVLMQNHGLIVCGQSPDEIRQRTDHVVERIEREIADVSPQAAFAPEPPLAPDAVRELVSRLAPVLRALLAEGPTLKVVTLDDSPLAVALACGQRGRDFCDLGPTGPDQIVYAGSYPLWFQPRPDETDTELIDRLRGEIDDYRTRNNLPPKVVVVQGVGILTAGDDYAAADTARNIYLNSLQILAVADQLGGTRGMTDPDRQFIEGWEAESYRARVASPKGNGRAAGKVALVTGAAQGFGLEISRALAEQGAHVVLADLNARGAADEAAHIAAARGTGRAIGAAINVTDPASIQDGLWQIIRTYGGLDLLISNAGVLKAGSVKSLPVKDFDFVTSVNYKGYFLCTQHVAPLLALQHQARPSYRGDIIQINSKSGLQGSDKNGAYAGGKFGGIGLTQSFALELVADGIKVNAICPGNFFEGPLWADPETGLFAQYLRAGKVPGAKTIEDVKRAYETKVPMARGCQPADVMHAIYYCLDQQYETGQAIPVTGGQVMLH